MAADGMARAIRPVHTSFDGDTVFALSTGQKALAEPQPIALSTVGAVAADTLARAIGRVAQLDRAPDYESGGREFESSPTLRIVKTVREIDKDFDTAALKAQMAEIYGNLADVKMALTDAQVTIHGKDQKIRELEKAIEDLRSGETCEVCQSGQMKTIDIKPHPTFGEVGVQEKTLQCDNPECRRIDKRMHDPLNLTAQN